MFFHFIYVINYLSNYYQKATFIEPLDKTETQIYVDGVKAENEDEDETNENDVLSYNLDNLNVTYHPSAEELEKEFGYGLGFDTTIVFDPSNNEMKAISMPNNQTYPLYNELKLNMVIKICSYI